MTFDAAFFEMLKASIMADIKAIDYSKTSFKLSVFFMLFNPIFWNTVAQLEFRKKFISRFTGPQIGCYLLAAVIFSLGLVRDFIYHWAVSEQPQSALLGSWMSTYLGPVLIVIGNILVWSSTYQLGITGTFLGDYFGILMNAKVEGFPFNVTSHPMYEGATLIFLGYALSQQSWSGLILTSIVAIVYSIASVIEGRMTDYIYSLPRKQMQAKSPVKARATKTETKKTK